MVEVRDPIEVSEAVKRVMKHKQRGEVESVSFHDSDWRRLAEPVLATNDVPSFDKSPYDGFALRAEDTKGASPENPVRLKVIEHIGAGVLPEKDISSGETTRIMTGAQIPEGANCVEMFEKVKETKEDGETYIVITHEMESGQNIIEKGSEIKNRTPLIEVGTLIDPGVKASLATFGYSEVRVAKKPVVGVVATGTELLDVDEPLEPGKIRNSNAYMICSQIERAGAEAKYLGTLPDDLKLSFEAIQAALTKVDILISTGGVSVGDFDHLPAIYEKLGANILFNKVAQRPGSVTTVAEKDGQLLFGLSGNPSACFVGFELYTRPIIEYALYSNRPYLPRIQAKLAEDFPKKNPFTRFVRTFVTYEGNEVFVHLAGMDKSNVVTSLAHTTSLMVLPAGTEGFQKGDLVDVLLVDSFAGQEQF
ncbi:MAG TPA: gephyrin-like molybdotransferase Glp [Bacillota bacterium]|nr:gephyrin-like molybdotransferase Glp [Bacillota bacterium]